LKRLLIINGNQFGYSAGHYYYCKYLADSYLISFVCFDRQLKKQEIDGVKVHYVDFSGTRLIRSYRFLKECVRQSYRVKPQLLLVTYFNYCSILAFLCKYENIVLDIRTASLNKNKTFRLLENYVISLQSLVFDHTLIISEKLGNLLHIQKKKSFILPLGAEVFYSGSHKFDSLRLLYVGSLDNRNISHTISGLYLFLQQHKDLIKDISYSIIGFGNQDEINTILKNIESYKISAIVKFEGRKSYNELIPYFELSNVGVAYVPVNPWYNYQPLTKLYEYLLSGMPVIATNTYENKLILNENHGILVNDSAEDFCAGLNHFLNKVDTYNSSWIRSSMLSNSWEEIVTNQLKPLLNNILSN
jgi:glycosyltransferase involved in cell wall biosynthesis